MCMKCPQHPYTHTWEMALCAHHVCDIQNRSLARPLLQKNHKPSVLAAAGSSFIYFYMLLTHTHACECRQMVGEGSFVPIKIRSSSMYMLSDRGWGQVVSYSLGIAADAFAFSIYIHMWCDAYRGVYSAQRGAFCYFISLTCFPLQQQHECIFKSYMWWGICVVGGGGCFKGGGVVVDLKEIEKYLEVNEHSARFTVGRTSWVFVLQCNSPTRTDLMCDVYIWFAFSLFAMTMREWVGLFCFLNLFRRYIYAIYLLLKWYGWKVSWLEFLFWWIFAFFPQHGNF